MSGVSLPIIPGAAAAPNQGRASGGSGGGGSRPNSSGSNYNYVPQVYYSSPQGIKTSTNISPRPQAIARSYNHLPSLRHHPGNHTSRPAGKKSSLTNNVRSRYSARHRRSPGPFSRASADSPYLPKANIEDCLKCLLRVPHKKCESHKYIRVGGGYRHGYWYIKCLLEELEIQRQRELLKQQRLAAIKEHRVKAIKTYIRTKSGRLVERIIFLSEEDYEAFKEGKNIQDLLKKYLTAEEAKGLESWDKDEVVAVKTYVRTKSGRLVEKLVYVSKEDYDAIKAGTKDAKDVLKKYAAEGEQIEGWEEAKMRTIKTYVRTKSGRLIEKTIMISEEDYQAMIKDGKDPNEIIKKYLPLEEGQTIESWQSGEPMKAIKTKIRTKSGRIIEKTIYVSADDYERMMEEVKQGRDPNAILQKYLEPGEGDIQGWEKVPEGNPMKVVKTYIRTKSGRLIEKTVMLTEDEYNAFVASGGNPDFLKKFIELKKGEVIEDWEKASTVYSATDDQEVQQAVAGQMIVGKDGTIYEVVVDPVTGKKYKKKVGHTSDADSGLGSMFDKHGRRKGKGGKGGKGGEEEETAEERARRKKGKRDKDSDSDYSYKSVYSAGGTKRVRRRRKRADGTYSDSESYHSSKDGDGDARRRRRRRERAHGGSAHSYYSVVSAGGTRHVRRKKKRADGTYSASESYHSSDSDKAGGGLHKKGKGKKKKRREHGSDSEYSYYSDVSAGGTRTRKRKRRIRDADGNVIGHSDAESYTSESDSERGKKDRKGTDGNEADSESEYEIDPVTGKKKKKMKAGMRRVSGDYEYEYDDKGRVIRKTRIGKGGDDDSGSEVEYEYDEHGNIIKEIRKSKKGGKDAGDEFEYVYDSKGRLIKKIRKGKHDGDEGSEEEYEYDKDGNLIGTKKTKGRKGSAADSDDGNYFEVDEKGKIKLREGKKKIDLSKLTADDLRKLGIDPNLSKQEIARLLKQKFGDDIQILDNRSKIGTKRLSEYGTDVDTDDLADDSDLDISTLKGTRRVNVLMKRGGQTLLEHMKRVLEQSRLQDDTYAKDLDERDGDIDFLSHYRLVDPKKLESYARAFVVEDEDFDTVIRSGETKQAIDGIASVNHITEKQLDYVFKVLKIDDATQVTFRMFAVISALCERVTQMDPLSKHLLEICDLLDVERKMELYKAMFYTNVNSDRDPNFIKADSLKIELIAGGLNWKQQEFIMEKLQPNIFNEISFLDYICYIPLFLSMHDNIVDNPLDMASNKYDRLLRKPSGLPRQRDHNPLGNPLSRDSSYQNRQIARNLLEGKIDMTEIKQEKREIVTKYTKLPMLLQEKEKSNLSRVSNLSRSSVEF